jgi:hypothetical protein
VAACLDDKTSEREDDAPKVQLGTYLAWDRDYLRVQKIEVSPKFVDDALPGTHEQRCPICMKATNEPETREFKLSCTATFETGTEKMTFEVMPSPRQAKVFDITKELYAWMEMKKVADKILLAELLRLADDILGDEGEIVTTEA